MRRTHDDVPAWWQYANDRRQAKLFLLGLAFMAVLSVSLIVAAVLYGS